MSTVGPPLDTPFPLPPFLLDEPLATGGMAEVWRGRHAASDAPVAVKLMRGDQAWQPAWQSAFRAEVRAVAGLSHPHIVRVHDYGLLPDAVEDLGRGLIGGTPYLVMEYVPGGTLNDRQVRGWSEFRWLISSLLDALAEAHAHGVVHRDIKPANVLFDAVQGRVKLTDFGIAHAMDRAELSVSDFEGGTPPYMAPEQFEARWRDYGPWTDLYALGCLAWTCVAGHPPFGKVSWMQGAIAHGSNPLPLLHTRFPVPPQLEAWLHRLLQKRPEHRFRRAADASWQLLHMDDAPEPILVDNLAASESPTVVLPKRLTRPWKRAASSGGAPTLPHAPVAVPIMTQIPPDRRRAALTQLVARRESKRPAGAPRGGWAGFVLTTGDADGGPTRRPRRALVHSESRPSACTCPGGGAHRGSGLRKVPSGRVVRAPCPRAGSGVLDLRLPQRAAQSPRRCRCRHRPSARARGALSVRSSTTRPDSADDPGRVRQRRDHRSHQLGASGHPP